MNLNRRAFLTSLGASTAAVVAAKGALPTAPLVYDVQATENGSGWALGKYLSSGVRLTFTAQRNGLIICRAISGGPNVDEAALDLAGAIRPEDPEAADWVLDTWLPQAVDGC